MEDIDRKQVEAIITNLASKVLVKDEQIDYQPINDFISALSDSQKKVINLCSDDTKGEYIVRTTVEERIKDYLCEYTADELGHPFDFDNSLLTYQEFIDNLIKVYKEKNNGTSLPKFFEWVFDEIKKASVQYHFVEKIYITLYSQEVKRIFENTVKDSIEEEASSQVRKQVAEQVNNVVLQAKQTAEEAAQKAEERANKAAKDAEQKAHDVEEKAYAAKASAKASENEAKEAANNAKKVVEIIVKDAVDKEMHNVTKHVSETSVTILGIFATIVLTVVGGFIYSTAVFQNLANTEINKLICVSSLVGFVCIALISAMFRFIANLSGKKEKEKRKEEVEEGEAEAGKEVEKEENRKKGIDWYTVGICSVLLVLFFIFYRCQAYSSNTSSNTTENTAKDSESSVETSSVGTSEIVSDDELVGLQNDTSSETE